MDLPQSSFDLVALCLVWNRRIGCSLNGLDELDRSGLVPPGPASPQLGH